MARKEADGIAQVPDGPGKGDGPRNDGAGLPARSRGFASAKAGAAAAAEYDTAYAHAVAGRAAQAEAICRGILAGDPTNAEALHLLGGIAAQGGNAPSAIELFTRALAAEPGLAKAHSDLGVLLLARGQVEEAIGHFEKAIASEPDFAPAYTNLGNALMASGRFEDAERAFEQAVKFEPENELAHNNLGAALGGQGRADEAIAQLEKAIELDPDLAMAHNNLGNALEQKENFEGAAASYRRALELRPHVAEVHSNLGAVYRALGRLDEALACHEQALALKPDYTLAHYYRSLVLLVQGRFAEGWEAYLCRPATQARAGELYRRPLPRHLSEQRIFLHREQGLGDEIFFLRFAPELKRRGASITYLANAKIASIIARLAFLDAVVAEDAAPEAADMRLSVGDLPYLLGMASTAEMPPSLTLEPLPERIKATAAKLAALGPAPYIGVTWRAGTRHVAGPGFRVAPLEGLAEVLGGVRGTFLALQRKPEVGEVDDLARAVGRPVHDFSAFNDDLEDMLALLALIDEYVTVSNTNVHLRAGAGRTSRVLVPHPPQYRWMAEGDESPWFPGCKVYRQKADGSWAAALAALARDLECAFRG